MHVMTVHADFNANRFSIVFGAFSFCYKTTMQERKGLVYCMVWSGVEEWRHGVASWSSFWSGTCVVEFCFFQICHWLTKLIHVVQFQNITKIESILFNINFLQRVMTLSYITWYIANSKNLKWKFNFKFKPF